METEIHLPSELFDYATPLRMAFTVLCCLGAIIGIGLSLAVYWICNKKDKLRKEKAMVEQVLTSQLDKLRKEKAMVEQVLTSQLDDLTVKLAMVENDLVRKVEILTSQLDFVNTNWSPDFVNTNWSPDFETIRRHAVDVTLDPDTSSPWVTLSEDRKQVRHGETRQDLPDNPERFDNTACVLGKEGFSSGSFYYEVQVKGKTWWKLGVVRESINKKGRITLSPDDGFWTVWLWNGEYKAATTPHVTLLLREKPLKVGVFVDYEKGQVSFYNVEARCHIYSFTGCTFTEKLYPFFNPGGSDSISLVVCPVDVTD